MFIKADHNNAIIIICEKKFEIINTTFTWGIFSSHDIRWARWNHRTCAQSKINQKLMAQSEFWAHVWLIICSAWKNVFICELNMTEFLKVFGEDVGEDWRIIIVLLFIIKNHYRNQRGIRNLLKIFFFF